jgi:sulfide:quinone oxidoreductase
MVHTGGGEQLPYDALLLAPGASMYTNYRHVMTLDPYRIDEHMAEIGRDIDGAEVQRMVFLVPDGPVWPLPIYELALVSARRARETTASLEITIVTPEPAPLAVFGAVVSDYVARRLAEAGIATVLSTISAVQGPGRVALHPGHQARAGLAHPGQTLQADQIIALPQLFGSHCSGVPTSALRGFISTDRQQRVPRLARAYAAGDATDFPIKFGGIASQQADVAAHAIAVLAGVDLEPVWFQPQLHAVFLTGERPVLFDAHPSGSAATHSRVTELAPGEVSRGKIDARYLAPYLQELDRATHELAS